MNIYPAIDLFEGSVVRLTRGDYAQMTIYSDQPEEIAKQWENEGASWLHIIDLEGAKTGSIQNGDALKKIRKQTGCNIEYGGGLRTFADVQRIVDLGVDRVIIGTRALDQFFFESLLTAFPERLAVGLDIRRGNVQTQGWLKSEDTNFLDALDHFNQYPLRTIIYTDIQKDGTLQGPNFKELEEALQISKANLILSGGISRLLDVEKCAQIPAKNFDGVIIGKALYEKKFTLKEALLLSLE